MCSLRRFDIKVGTYSGLESWPESGFFCLLFLAVEEKYGRAPGRGLKKAMDGVSAAIALVRVAHALSRSDAVKS